MQHVAEKLRNLYKNKLRRFNPNQQTRESKVNLKFKTKEGILNFNPFVPKKNITGSLTDRKRGKPMKERIRSGLGCFYMF